VGQGHTPINVVKLLQLLSSYPNTTVAAELSYGFADGFRLMYTGPRRHVMSKNLVSATEFQSETLATLNKKVSSGRILGPFNNIPISTLHLSPIGVIPKPDGTWRLITNLSHPISDSINYYINEKYSKVCYSSLDNILDKLYDLGKGALLGKIDIKSAFRLLLINPADFDFLGIVFNGKFYIDKCLSMGAPFLVVCSKSFLRFFSGSFSSEQD
jgi:hypothetical protein